MLASAYRRGWCLLILAAFCLLLPACGSRVNLGRYDEIRNGDGPAEVETLIGVGASASASEVPAVVEDPRLAEVLQSAKWFKWQDRQHTAYVAFIDEKVVYRTRTGN
jgi:hypothetical protein